MPSVATGLAGAVRVNSEWVIDPDLGDSIEETWQGLKYQIFSLAQGFKKIGAKARVTHRGPLYQVIVTIGQTPARGVEVPVDKYEWDSEQFQVSIFNAAGPSAEALSYSVSANVPLSRYRQVIEDAVKKGTDIAVPFPSESSFPWAWSLYRRLSVGVEAYPLKRLVLRRVRTFSLDYAGRIELSATPIAYSTAALVSTFAIPNKIALQLPEYPSNADTPAYTRWGWWMRTDRSEQIPALNKVEEVREWVFAAWSTADFAFVVLSTEVASTRP